MKRLGSASPHPARPSTTPIRRPMPDTRSRFCARALFLLATALGWSAPPVGAGLTLMHGYADSTSAIVWIMSDAPGPVDVTWRPAGARRQHELRLDATTANGNVVLARLSGLVPGQPQAYRVSGDGERRDGIVRTLPAPMAAAGTPSFTLAIGSCYFLSGDYPKGGARGYGGSYGIFDAIAATRPDAMLWLGDNVYLQPPDFTDPGAKLERYRRQRSFAPLQRLLTATAHVAIWDDHDYGPNNANATYPGKQASLELFRRYWPNPQAGLPDVPGIFGRVSYGDIDVFMLDGRWYRADDRAAEAPDKTMLGAAQLEWLRRALQESRAPVKLIAGGSQFLNRANRFEGWHHFAAEQQAFLAFLLERRIEGVVFLSGDRHFGELLKLERPGAYPLYEFTSSPLTARPWGRPDRAELVNPDLVPGTLVGKRQFGLIHATGAGEERMLALESRDASGTLLWRHEIPVRDLAFARR